MSTRNRGVTILIPEIGPSWRFMFSFFFRLLYSWGRTHSVIWLRGFMASETVEWSGEERYLVFLPKMWQCNIEFLANSNKSLSGLKTTVNIKNSPNVETHSVRYIILLLLSQSRHSTTYPKKTHVGNSAWCSESYKRSVLELLEVNST